jgi:hypothetical protein
MTRPNPDEKRGGYGGSAPKDEVKVPQGPGATATPAASGSSQPGTGPAEKSAA